MMKLKNVIDEFGNEVIINEDNQKLYSYNNKKRILTYNAQEYKDGKPTGFWIDYTEEGVATDIEERMKVWNSKLSLAYADTVDYNPPKNDPNKKIWNSLVALVKEHEDAFFDSNGDLLDELVISTDEIKDMRKLK